MPKAKKNTDFQKTKLKLGKKQQANNATNTFFKARTIALPQQSINVDKSDRLTNSRNLGVIDLAQQLRHYGAVVRKEAVLGVKEILQLHPSLIHSAVGQLIPDLCRVIGDDDAGVRRNVYSLFSWYLAQIPAALLSPYINALLLFTASALSHIYPEVRQDAVKVLDLLIQVAPTVATAGWENAVHKFAPTGPSSTLASLITNTGNQASNAAGGDQLSHGERFMSCYLNLLGITHRTTSSSAGAASTTATDLSSTAKLLILRSLRTFLVAATDSTSDPASHPSSNKGKAPEEAGSTRQAAQPRLDCPTWFFRPCFKGEADFEHFEGLMRPDLRKRNARSFAERVAADQGEKAAATKSKKRKAAMVQESTESDFHSAEFGAASLVDIERTLGRSWGAGDLHNALLSAASGDLLSLTSASSSNGAQPSSSSSPASASLHLFTLLQPVMVAIFLDTAPSAFRPNMDLHSISVGRGSAQNIGLSTPAEIISHLLGLCLTLWRSAISSSSTGFGSTPIRVTKTQRGELSNILGHMAAYFPFSQQGTSSKSSALSQKAKSVTLEMDLGFSELTSLLALSICPNSLSTEGKNRINLSVQLDLVSRYISELLSSADVSGTVSLAGNAVSALDQETYATLLPTVWLLLNTSESDLFDSVLSHFERCSSSSKVKTLAFEFIARIWILQTFQTDASFRLAPFRERLSKWLETLPRILWEISATDSGSGPRKVLEFLRYMLSSNRTLISQAEKEAIREKMAPFFWFRHPAKGVDVPGPFAKLAAEERKEAVALVEWLGCGAIEMYKDKQAAKGRLASAVRQATA